jgi:tetratricopeptide (TPR) repeat protein
LFRETEGLPLFVAEYLQGLHAQPPTDTAWALPGGVRALLHQRLRGVNERDRQVLMVAAVIGRSFDFDTVRAASGQTDNDTITALEHVMAHGLIAEQRTGNDGAMVYDFSHDKLRSVVYDDMSLARRRVLHRRVADALAQLGQNGVLAGRIAQQYRLAGDHRQAATYFKLAGDYARSVYANNEARTHYEHALTLDHADRTALHEALGDVHTLLGDYGAAITSYAQARGGCFPAECAVIEHKLANVYQRRGAWAQAQTHLHRALNALGDEEKTALRARIYADLSLAAHMAHDQGAQHWAQQALHLAEDVGDTRALAQAHNIVGMLASRAGDLARAQHHLEASAALAEQGNDPGAQAAALNNLALTYGAGNDLERALELANHALALSSAQGDRHREAALHNNLADLYHAAGRSADALAHLKQAVTIYAEIGVEGGTVQPEIWKLTEW